MEQQCSKGTELKELEASQMEALPVIKDPNNCLLPRIILCYSKLANKALQRCLILETHVKFKKDTLDTIKIIITPVCPILDTSV